METKLPNKITNIAEAKQFLSELIKNNECYHPEDNAHDCFFQTCNAPTPAECDKLNNLMQQIYDLNYDPCEFIVDRINFQTF